MAEFFGDVWAAVEEMLSIPLIRFCFYGALLIPLLRLPYVVLSSLVGSDFHLDCSGFFDWIYDRFIDLLKMLFGFEFIYKHGLARPGVDFVECDSCFCSECTFRDQCPVDRKAEMAALKGEDLSDG